MSWFEDSNIKKSYIVQTVSDVGIFSACTQIYLTNILPCAGDTINITGNLGVSGNISGTTYYGDGSQLSGIVTTDNYVTGGVYSASTETLYFTGTTGFTPFSVDVSALLDDTNSYVTGGTYNPTTDIVTLTRNDNVSINITGVSNTFTTGATYDEGTELITFVRNDGNTYTADLSAIVSATTNSYTTGATLNGNIIEFANSVLGLNYYNVDLTPIVSGFTTGNTLQEVLDNGSSASILTDFETIVNNGVSGEGNLTVGSGYVGFSATDGTGTLSSQYALGSNAFELTAGGGGKGVRLDATLDWIDLSISENPSKDLGIFIGNDTNTVGIKLTDTFNNRGAFYEGDYSTNGISEFGDRWIPDKGWVDAQIAGIPTPTLQQVMDQGSIYSGSSIVGIALGAGSSTSSTLTLGPTGSYLDMVGGFFTSYFNVNTSNFTWESNQNTGNIRSRLGAQNSSGDHFFDYRNASNKIQGLSFNGTSMIFTDEVNLKGWEYADDYTANFTTRSLVDKGYVDNNTSGFVETTLFNIYTGDTETTLNSKIESASNIGGANEVFSGKSGTDLQFRTISGGSNTTITTVGGIIKIDTTGGGSTTPTLQEVLSSGNTTSGNDIIMTEGDDVVFKYSGWNNRINTQPLTTHRGINFPDNDGTVALVSDTTGYTETTLFNTYTGDTETALNSKLDTTSFNVYSGSVETQLNSKTDNTDFTSHTGDTTIHYTKGSINLSDLGSSAHTHSISEVVNLQTELDSKTNTSLFNTHTGDTNNPHQTSFSNLTSTAHTHSISDVINLQTELDNKLASTTFNSYTGSVVDVFVSSGNANVATQQLSFTNTTGGTFNVTNAAALFSDNDINVTGGTYNPTTGCVTFTTNSGTTFDVCGFVTGITDTFVTGYTYSDNTFTLSRNQGLADLTSTINTMTGLTVNGVLSATTYTGITLDGIDDVTTGIPTTPGNEYQGRQIYFDVTSNEWIATQEYGTLGTVTIWGKKGSAGTIDKGCPVYITGFDNDIHDVELANASTGATMPVIGFTGEDFDDTTTNPIITFGKLTGVNTTSGTTTLNPNGETWEVNDELYMSTTTGGLTKFRPTGTNTQIQRIAKVLKIGTTNGQLFIFNTARTAGLPNLTTDYVWLGDGNDTPQEVIKTDLGVSVTGFSYDNNNTFTITDDNSGSYTATINQMSGLTVDGTLTLNSVGGTTSVTNLGIDSNGNVVSGDSLDNVALVGTYTNNYVPRWNATTNTLQSGSIRDNGTDIGIGTGVNSNSKVRILGTTSNTKGVQIDMPKPTSTAETSAIYSQFAVGSPSQSFYNNIYSRTYFTADPTNGTYSAGRFILGNESTASTDTIATALLGTVRTQRNTDSIYGMYFDVLEVQSGDIIANNAYGLYLPGWTGAGTVTGTEYGIYQEGTDKNYFGGQLQLNTIGGTTSVTNLGIDASGNVVSGDTGGDVFKVGTPANNQIGVWTGDGTLEGDSNLTWNDGLDMSSTTQFGVDLTHNPSGTDSTIAGYNVDLTGNVDSDNTYGVYSKVDTSLNGNAYGGFFQAKGSASNATGSYNKVGGGNVAGLSIGAYNLVSIDGALTTGNNIYGSFNVVTLSTTGTHGPSIIGSGVDLNYNKVGGTLTSAFGFYSTGIVCNDSGSTVTNAYGLYLGDNAGAGTITNSFGVYQAGTDDKNYFAGNVGIGTDTPDGPLHVETSTGVATIRVKSSGNTSSAFHAINKDGAGITLGISGSRLKLNNTGSLNDNHLVIDSSGNVGINTNSPTQKLHIYDSFANSLANFESGDERVNIRFNDSLTTNTPIIGASGNTITFGHISGGDKVSILESGNVGIGTETPTEKLDVSGNVKVSGEIIIGTVNSGTPVTNLAVDSSGNVVEASTSVSDQNKIFSWFMNVS